MSKLDIKHFVVVGFAVAGIAISQMACSDPNYNGNADRSIVATVQAAVPELKEGIDKATDKIKKNVDDTGKLMQDTCEKNGSCK